MFLITCSDTNLLWSSEEAKGCCERTNTRSERTSRKIQCEWMFRMYLWNGAGASTYACRRLPFCTKEWVAVRCTRAQNDDCADAFSMVRRLSAGQVLAAKEAHTDWALRTSISLTFCAYGNSKNNADLWSKASKRKQQSTLHWTSKPRNPSQNVQLNLDLNLFFIYTPELHLDQGAHLNKTKTWTIRIKKCLDLVSANKDTKNCEGSQQKTHTEKQLMFQVCLFAATVFACLQCIFLPKSKNWHCPEVATPPKRYRHVSAKFVKIRQKAKNLWRKNKASRL